MSDTPATSENTSDASLGPRRAVAGILSIILGAAVTAIAIQVLLHVNFWVASFPMAFIPEVPLWPVATVPLALFFLIWVDYFMGTRILPD